MGSGEHHKHQMEKVLILKQTFCVETLYSITLKYILSSARHLRMVLRFVAPAGRQRGKGEGRKGKVGRGRFGFEEDPYNMCYMWFRSSHLI